jgi:structural maintenance of chromosome 1
LFNKAYNHISDRIDQVYKDLTKGKASPMGGVAYLSLEDSEVRLRPSPLITCVDRTK